MIASGVTCIADMYMRTGVIADEIVKAGISANLSCGGVYFGAPADFSPDTCGDCRNQIALTEQWHKTGGDQILVDASIHGEYTSCAPLWQWMADFAHTHGQRMHVHVSETRSEHADSLSRHGLTPIQVLDKYGVWENGGIAAHCVYTTPEDWAIMAAKDVTAVHNPYSNLKLGSGVAPTPDMLKAGVNISLGTDGMSSHNSCDMFQDMKLAAILPCGVGCDPMAMNARRVLEMATVNGARALGRNTGRIAAGCTADLILVDFEAPNLVPCHDIAENLVFSANGSNVVMNMARGKVIYRNGEFLTLDLDRIKAEVRTYALPLIFG
jgi:5-methylthioadenosine/S-adenosylhomocysteine deaminase